MIARKRSEELVVEQSGDELLVLDVRTNAAHQLDEDAAAVWLACGRDGGATTAGIAQSTGSTEAVVEDTLTRLAALDLIHLEGSTRRQALGKASMIGAGALVAVPVIRSIILPEAAQAGTQGGSGSPCTTGADCTGSSGVCNNPSGMMNAGVCA